MLYLTTRDRFDTFTAFRTVTSNTAPNGGLFLPFKMPKFDVNELAEQTFGDCIATVLNSFFSTRLTGKEVEFCIGRSPVRIKCAQQRTVIAELFRNLDGSYDKMEKRLAAKICSCLECEERVTSWVSIAIRIAVLFGVCAEMRKQEMGESVVDISLPCRDFRLPMAAWYAREMGLPVGNIICACGQDSGVWELLRHGEMRTAAPESAFVEFERLICGTLGVDQAVNYHNACVAGAVYSLEEEETQKLNSGIFCAVVSADRVERMIAKVFNTNFCIFVPGTAVSYSGLMDYRAKTGESRTALLLADENPVDFAPYIASALNMTEDALMELLRS